MNRLEIIYRSRPDATPASELDVLCDAYDFLLETAREKEATRPGGPDDRTQVQGDSADAPIIQK